MIFLKTYEHPCLLKDVRLSMLKGERHPVCKRCNEEDDSGVDSRRMRERGLYHDDFTFEYSQKITEEDGTIPVDKVPLLAADVRLSNLCNQKCRMCYPAESSTWYQEWHDTFHIKHSIYNIIDYNNLPSFTGPGNIQVYLDQNKKGKAAINGVDVFNWTENKELFTMLYKEAPDVKDLHISGGEPLMINEHYEFLQGYVDSGKAKDILINYNTNLSNIPERALELWQHFKVIEIRASIDGPYEANEYIRHPSNWDIIVRNLKLLHKHKQEKKINLSLAIITTVQIYNIFYLNELYDAIDKLDIEYEGIFLHLLHDPQYFNITSLPEEIKHIAAEKIQSINDKKQVNGIIKHMYQTDTSESLEQFFIETGVMDTYRNQKFKQSLPELYNQIKQYDPSAKTKPKIEQIYNNSSIVRVSTSDTSHNQQVVSIRMVHKTT